MNDYNHLTSLLPQLHLYMHTRTQTQIDINRAAGKQCTVLVCTVARIHTVYVNDDIYFNETEGMLEATVPSLPP